MGICSPLTQYVDISPHNYGKRKCIKGVTIHHMAMKASVETCGQVFHRKNASSNYGIGYDGKIACYCYEEFGACTSSNKKNDMEMITIEVSNDLCAPYWTISPEAMNRLILLCADICMRNNIPALIWSDKKSDRVYGVNGVNMTVHRDFANTFCCGDFLYGCMPSIALAVNNILSGQVPPTAGYFINGYDYDPVFDPEYYANKYPDLEGAFGHDADALWQHFQTFGMNEFRQASAEFNPQAYKDRYPDLVEAFGLDNPMYYFHYVACGKAEGRNAS